ncbi:hypothetical protein HORIV_32730 [Vreelandella olivaria]|uniref:Uncharacterized protein n=1 Tax=Vreelandella olivaria TaxID=390919 RepID=A0ABN5X1Y6_9GAMM|nr:hypothetical protein HORIV_32730 [Halomonas olivaria]
MIHRFDEFGTTVGVEHVVATMGAIVNSSSANVDSLGNCQREQNHIAVGHHGSAKVIRVIVTLGHGLIWVGERRVINQAVYRTNIDYLMGQAQRSAHLACSVEFAGMALTIVKGKCVYVKAFT